MSDMFCNVCKKNPRADGWVFCPQCAESIQKKRLAERKKISNEDRQRSGNGSGRKSLLDLDADEQIGGASSAWRKVEDSRD
jgi:uncharacterized Zn finger protein (UPF0148 family)